MLTVTVRKAKRPRGGNEWRAYTVDEDRYGMWLYCPQGSAHRFLSRGGSWTVPCPAVQLLPTASWWVAWWWLDEEAPRATVDVCTPATLSNGAWTYDDLELDPVVESNGVVKVVDQDEFDVACAAGVINEAESVAAMHATTEVVAMMREEAEPFGRLGWEIARRCAQLDLPALS